MVSQKEAIRRARHGKLVAFLAIAWSVASVGGIIWVITSNAQTKWIGAVPQLGGDPDSGTSAAPFPHIAILVHVTLFYALAHWVHSVRCP